MKINRNYMIISIFPSPSQIKDHKRLMNVTKQVRKPAIGLILVAICNVLIWLTLFNRLITDQGEWTTKFFMADWLNVLFLYLPGVLGVETLSAPPVLLVLKVGVLINLIIFYGAAHMMASQRYYLSYSCSVLAMIPLISPLFFIGLPIGIWAIRTLKDPQVRAALLRNEIET